MSSGVLITLGPLIQKTYPTVILMINWLRVEKCPSRLRGMLCGNTCSAAISKPGHSPQTKHSQLSPERSSSSSRFASVLWRHLWHLWRFASSPTQIHQSIKFQHYKLVIPMKVKYTIFQELKHKISTIIDHSTNLHCLASGAASILHPSSSQSCAPW